MRDRGSSTVEFTLVSVLLVGLFLGVLQLGFVLHTRNVLVASAQEGARYGANADRGPADAQARTREVIATALSGTVEAAVRETLADAARGDTAAAGRLLAALIARMPSDAVAKPPRSRRTRS